MNLKLEIELSKADILKEAGTLKKQVDDMRPLPTDVEGRVMQKLRLDWNYHSNAIEGNRLNYGETVAFLMEGITAKGKPLKDHLDIRGHNEAINFLLEIVKDPRPLSEADIRALHKMILVEPYDVKAQTASGLPTTKRVTLGEYKSQPNHVKTATGEMHYYAAPEETPAKMQELMEWYAGVTASPEIHPVVAAALFHHKFVAIHPFDDGNGRLSRILMNLILMQNGYPPVVIKMDNRQNYYSLLSRADNGESWPFVEYVLERLLESLKIFVRAIKGEEEDIDKEIALFKLDVMVNTDIIERKSEALINTILLTKIEPLFEQIIKKGAKLADLFFDNSHFISINEKGNDIKAYESINNFFGITTSNGRQKTIENLKSVGLMLNFENFRNSKNDFDIKIWLVVTFSDYYYEFFDNSQTKILTKFYHEVLSNEDQNQIIKVLINNLKSQIIDMTTK